MTAFFANKAQLKTFANSLIIVFMHIIGIKVQVYGEDKIYILHNYKDDNKNLF